MAAINRLTPGAHDLVCGYTPPADYTPQDGCGNPALALTHAPKSHVDWPAVGTPITRTDPWTRAVLEHAQTKLAAQALTRKQVDAAGNTITYVTERMCNAASAVVPVAVAPAAGPPTARSWCDMLLPKQPPGTTINDPLAGVDFRQVYYRVTVRVDGPPGTNAVSFAQAMLR